MTDQRCEDCGSLLAEDCGDCPVCAVYGPPAVGMHWTTSNDPMADIKAGIDQALTPRKLEPAVITDRQADTLRKIHELLGLGARERAFAAAVAERLRPGWTLVLEPACEPDTVAFFDHWPDRIFAGRDVYAAMAPRVAELGGKL